MSFSKNALIRYRIINKCLSSKVKKHWKKVELMEKIAEEQIPISPRTLDEDIYNMKNNTELKYFAPIEYCRANMGYYYTRHFSIEQIPLNELELQELELAAGVLQRYSNTNMIQQFQGSVNNLTSIIKEMRKGGRDLSFVEFEKAPYYKGAEHLDLLMDHIHNKRCLKITYQKFNEIYPKDYVVHPYILKEFRNRWYVVGLNDASKKPITLGFERVLEVVEVKYLPFIENTVLSVKEYFKHTLGVTHYDAPVEKILLKFSSRMGYYIKTQYLHETQEIIIDNEDGLVVQLQLIPNPELISMILMYGGDVEVLEPLSLRQQVKEGLEKALERYEG